MNPIKHAWGLKTASQLTVRKHLPRPGIGNFSLCRLDSECYSTAGHTSLSHSLSSETVMQKWPRATHEPIATVCANKTLSWKTCGSLELYQQPVLVNSWPRFWRLGLKAWRGLEIREQKTVSLGPPDSCTQQGGNLWLFASGWTFSLWGRGWVRWAHQAYKTPKGSSPKLHKQ